MFWLILSYCLTLALGVVGVFNQNKKLIGSIFVGAIVVQSIYFYQQKDEFNEALVQQKDAILSEIREELTPPDFEKVKTIVKKRGLKFNDFLNLLEEGSPLERGIKAALQNQYDEALMLFEQNIIQKESETAISWFYVGQVHYDKKHFFKAIDAYEKALVFSPNDCLSWTMWGSSLGKMHQFDEAIIKHKKAIEVAPQCSQAYNNLGYSLNSIGEFSQAIDFIEKAVVLSDKEKKTNRQLAVIKINLGMSLAGLGKIAEAKEKFQDAIKIDPNIAEPYNNLANYAEFPEAEKLYQKALEIDPDFATAYYNWGTKLNEQGIYDLAEEKLRKAIEKDIYFVKAYHSLGNLLLHEAMGIAPKVREGLKGFPGTEVLVDKDKALEAETLLRKAVNLSPNNAAMHFNLGTALRSLEKHEEAKVEYRKAIDLDPKWGVGIQGPALYYPELLPF